MESAYCMFLLGMLGYAIIKTYNNEVLAMPEELFVQSVISIISLLFVAAFSATILKRIKFPYTIGLVIVGIVVGYTAQHIPFLTPLKDVRLTPNIIMYILLPTLIFEASFNIDSRLLVKNLTPVLTLAAPGLILSTVIVGALTCWLTPLTMGEAMLFGALISATDPVAVITLFKEVGAPKRLTMLVDGESLFNDATAIVAFRIVLGIVASSAAFSMMTIVKGAGSFCLVFAGGLLAGAVVGYIIIKCTAFAKDDPLIQIAFTTVAAYIAFVVADHYLKVSGVMAAMGAGMVLSWYGVTRFSPEVKQYLEQFWSYAAFVANSFIFLLLGFSEEFLLADIKNIPGLIIHVSIGVGAVLVARIIVIYSLVPILNRLPGQTKIKSGYKAVLFWGGLRGAVPLALAFSLTDKFPHRQLMVEMTLAVVLFTLLFQGTTINLLIRLFKLDKPSLLERFTEIVALLDVKEKAKKRVNQLEKAENFSLKSTQKFKTKFDNEIASLQAQFNELKKSEEFNTATIRIIMWTQAISICRQSYFKLYENKVISESVLRELNLERVIELEQIKAGKTPKIILEKLPLERKFSTILTHILGLLFTHTKFHQRMQAKNLSTKYEILAALYAASNNVISILDQLAGACNADQEILEECEQFYKTRADEAAKKISALSIELPDVFENWEESTLNHIAISAELEEIDAVAANGGIPEAVAYNAEQKIRSEY
jgi:CPA1 family monovalent cation:H+ antiporter